ncbi:hypothetical protein ABFV05_009718 [Capra hircus]
MSQPGVESRTSGARWALSGRGQDLALTVRGRPRPLRSWEPQGAGTSLRAEPPAHTMGRVGGGRPQPPLWARASSSWGRSQELGQQRKPPPPVSCPPTPTLRNGCSRRLGGWLGGGNGSATPCSQGMVTSSLLSACSGGVCPSRDPPLQAEPRARERALPPPQASPQLSPSRLQRGCQQRQLRPLPRAQCNRHGGAASARAWDRAPRRKALPSVLTSPPSPQSPARRVAWAPEPGVCGGVRRQRFSAQPSHSSCAGRGGDARSELRGGELGSAAPWSWRVFPGGSVSQAGAAAGSPPSTARSPARAPAALPPPLSSPPGRRKLVLASSLAAARPPAVRRGGPGADRLRSPSATPPCTARLPDWVAVTAAPRSNFFPLYSLLKVEAWGREEKTQCRKGRCGLTCQRWRRKTPRSGRALEPAQGPEPWVRAERRGGGGGGGGNASARCPPSAGPALPRRPLPRAPRSPPHRQGPGNPPARFFCAVSAKLRGSWSFCSTIYRLRQHCEKEKAERWPLPPPLLQPAPGREKPQHTT